MKQVRYLNMFLIRRNFTNLIGERISEAIFFLYTLLSHHRDYIKEDKTKVSLLWKLFHNKSDLMLRENYTLNQK